MATQHFPKWSMVDGDIRINVDLSRFDKQYQKAQYGLDGDVMNSMLPFMPMQQGSFINVTRGASAAIQGTGQVYAAFAPQGRYLYEGFVMVDKDTGKGPRIIPDVGPRWKKGAKLVSTYRKLTYTKQPHPDAQDHWYDAAKEKDGKQWVKNAKKNAGGGKRG